MFVIYGLHLEGDDEIRYVGSTCTPQSRLRQHLGKRDEKNPQKQEWINGNRTHVKMRILQKGVSENDRRKAEQRAIKECQNKGHRLFNVRRATNDIQATTEDVAWWLDRLDSDKPY